MKNLNVPYMCQWDGKINPAGSCNVTSVAMVLKFLGFVGDGSSNNFEDQIYKKMESKGLDRHEAWDLKKIIDGYPGTHDDYTENGTLHDIRQAINEGKPCIVHGYFTANGHIIVIRGYDAKGFFVNDPAGLWIEGGHYNGWKSGENRHYTNEFITETCDIDGIWIHRVSRKK